MGYYSRKFQPRQGHYLTAEKEYKLAINALRVSVLGRRYMIKTDHQSSEWLDFFVFTPASMKRYTDQEQGI